MTEIHTDNINTDWINLRKTLSQNLCEKNIVQQYIKISQQNKLLEDIKQEIIKKKSKYQHSFQQNIQFNNSNFLDGQIKSKFTQQFQEIQLNSAFDQIRSKCTSQTYLLIKNTIDSCKGQQYNTILKNYQKIKKQNQELNASNLSLHKEKSNILWELNMLKPKVQGIQQEKIKIKKQMDQLMDKQTKLFKIQASLAFKEKISLEGRKRYQRQKQSTILAQRKLQQTIQCFQKLWNQIKDKCDSYNCPQQCWKKDAMKKCKQKLMQQRQALKAQQQQIEKQYEIIANLSSQFKKLFANIENNNKPLKNI